MQVLCPLMEPREEGPAGLWTHVRAQQAGTPYSLPRESGLTHGSAEPTGEAAAVIREATGLRATPKPCRGRQCHMAETL